MRAGDLERQTMTDQELAKAIEAAKAEVARLEQSRRDLREARKKLVKRQWKFTLSLKKLDSWDRVREGSQVVVYHLHGEVTNKEEVAEFYPTGDYHTSGGMSYYFNQANGKFIGSTGGGSIFINQDGGLYDKDRAECKEDSDKVWSLLEEFVKVHPEGGDVTEIINLQRHLGWS